MLADFIRRYRQIIVLAVASVAIAAYVIPFNAGNPAQTQAQQSLYERLQERLGDVRERVGGALDEVEDNVGPNPRIDEGRERLDSALDEANDRIADRLGGGTGGLEANTADEEDTETGTESLSAEEGNEANSNEEEDGANTEEEANDFNSDEVESNDNGGDNDAGSNARELGDQIRERANEIRENARN